MRQDVLHTLELVKNVCIIHASNLLDFLCSQCTAQSVYAIVKKVNCIHSFLQAKDDASTEKLMDAALPLIKKYVKLLYLPLYCDTMKGVLMVLLAVALMFFFLENVLNVVSSSC